MMDLAELITLTDPVKAEMLKNILNSRNIKCILKSKASHTVHPFTVDGLAETKILVSVEMLEKAKRLLEQYNF